MRRRGQVVVLGMALAGSVILALGSILRSPWRLLYNPSESAPRGWYWLHPGEALEVNDFALLWMPTSAREIANARNYLPYKTPLLKRVGAVQGQWVCYRDGAVWIDWRRAGLDRTIDTQGRPLTAWKACVRLAPGEYFLLSVTSDASFDSRYFGPVASGHILGAAYPLWTW